MAKRNSLLSLVAAALLITLILSGAHMTCFWTNLNGVEVSCADSAGWSELYSVVVDPADYPNEGLGLSGGTWQHASDMLVTDDGVIHAVIGADRGSSGSGTVILHRSYYVRSTDKGVTWSTPVVMDASPYGQGNYQNYSPAGQYVNSDLTFLLLTDGTNLWYVITTGNNDGSEIHDYLLVIKSTDGGDSWNSVLNTSYEKRPIGGVVDSGGDILVFAADYHNVYQHGDEVFPYFQRISGDGSTVVEVQLDAVKEVHFDAPAKQAVVLDGSEWPHIVSSTYNPSGGYEYITYYRPTGPSTFAAGYTIDDGDTGNLDNDGGGANIIRLASGRLVIFYNISRNNTYIRTSDNNGVSWGVATNILFNVDGDLRSAGATSVHQDSGGTVHLIYAAYYGTVYHMTSEDDCNTWSEPAVIPGSDPNWGNVSGADQGSVYNYGLVTAILGDEIHALANGTTPETGGADVYSHSSFGT